MCNFFIKKRQRERIFYKEFKFLGNIYNCVTILGANLHALQQHGLSYEAKTPLFKMWLANQHFCNIGFFCCKLKQRRPTCIAGGLFVSQSSVSLLRTAQCGTG